MKAKVHHFLALLLGFLGVSCDFIHEIIDAPAEYGMPHADYSVKGRVTDKAGTPIRGIRVTPLEDDRSPVYGVSFTTGEDGGFSGEFTAFPREKMKIVFDDVDGEENGGSFASDTLEVSFRKVKNGDGNWYGGVFSPEKDIEESLSARK